MSHRSKIIRLPLLFIALIGFVCTLHSQGEFKIDKGKKRDKIKFELVNNLIIIPIEVNGTELSFLLDTGVNATILFSLTPEDTLEIKKATPVKIKGLGSGGSIDGLKSIGNTIRVGNTIDKNHTLYFVYDESLNFSPRMGTAIHGILGYDFFKDFIVKTNYISQYLTVYNPDYYKAKICKTCRSFDLIFNANKPFIEIEITVNDKKEDVVLLVDSGSSDALWLFDDFNVVSENPKNYFEDFLGLGLSGDIYGKRSRLKRVSLGDFFFKEISVAFPEFEAIESALTFEVRKGSLGGAFLKRFTTTFDYRNKKLILKKNQNFDDPFFYNMSGLTLEHSGVDYFRREVQPNALNSPFNKDADGNATDFNTVSIIKNIEFVLVPRYIVAEIREGSPAQEVGISKGDEILKINGKPAHYYKLYELNSLFSSKENRKISMQIRDQSGQTKNLKFTLKRVL